jgi:hypothetical protein
VGEPIHLRRVTPLNWFFTLGHWTPLTSSYLSFLSVFYILLYICIYSCIYLLLYFLHLHCSGQSNQPIVKCKKTINKMNFNDGTYSNKICKKKGSLSDDVSLNWKLINKYSIYFSLLIHYPESQLYIQKNNYLYN